MDDLFPTSLLENETDITESTDTGFGRSWKFNYELGEFEMTPTGKMIETDGFDAWVEWCQKALSTNRFEHLIYSSDFGQEFKNLIGRSLSREANESELQRMITECLLVNPRTSAVEDFSFYWEDDRVFYTCIIYNVRGESKELNGKAVIT